MTYPPHTLKEYLKHAQEKAQAPAKAKAKTKRSSSGLKQSERINSADPSPLFPARGWCLEIRIDARNGIEDLERRQIERGEDHSGELAKLRAILAICKEEGS